MASLVFTGYIDNDGVEYDYMDFIDTLRAMSQADGATSADVHFSLIQEDYTEEKDRYRSPMMRIDFQQGLYIHEVCPGNFIDGFQDWQPVPHANYPG